MRAFGLLILLAVGLPLTGCASMCDSSFDCDFHAFGGLRDRIDRTHGRVASAFNPAEATPYTPPEPLPVPDVEYRNSYSDVLNGDDDEVDTDDSELENRLLEELNRLESLPDIPSDYRDEPTGNANEI